MIELNSKAEEITHRPQSSSGIWVNTDQILEMIDFITLMTAFNHLLLSDLTAINFDIP